MFRIVVIYLKGRFVITESTLCNLGSRSQRCFTRKTIKYTSTQVIKWRDFPFHLKLTGNE